MACHSIFFLLTNQKARIFSAARKRTNQGSAMKESHLKFAILVIRDFVVIISTSCHKFCISVLLEEGDFKLSCGSIETLKAQFFDKRSHEQHWQPSRYYRFNSHINKVSCLLLTFHAFSRADKTPQFFVEGCFDILRSLTIFCVLKQYKSNSISFDKHHYSLVQTNRVYLNLSRVPLP